MAVGAVKSERFTAAERRIEMLERVLERSVTIPGLNRQIGLDAIAGLIPVGGDLVTAAMGLYLVWEARNLGLPAGKLWRMVGNVAFDTALGSIPVVGDAFDFAFRSNTRNLRLIRRHFERSGRRPTELDRGSIAPTP